MRNICKRYKITTERADLFDVNMTVGIAVAVNGGAAEEQIRSAFEKAVSCHGILRTRVVIDKDGSAYYTEHSENNNRVFFSDRDLSAIWKEQEKIRFQVENGEYMGMFTKSELAARLAGFLQDKAFFRRNTACISRKNNEVLRKMCS